MDYRDCKFGIEMEYSSCSRKASGDALAGLWGTRCAYYGGSYKEYHVTDPQGRTWKIMRDSSVSPTGYGSNASDDYKCELVSPVLVYSDMSMLQEVIRAIRGAGGKSNRSCGFHVHLSCPEEFNVKQLTCLINMCHSKQNLVYEALQVYESRQNFCRKIPVKLCETIRDKKPRSMDALANIYYDVLGGNYGRYDHYNNARYYMINAHNLFSERLPTVEFRCANGSLTDARRARATIEFYMLMVAESFNKKSCSFKVTVPNGSIKYTFRVFLLSIGCIGDELAICRKFMLERLDGNIAWRDRV